MSKEKQVEEMTKIIESVGKWEECTFGYYKSKAKALYDAGYRKQSEWIIADEYLPDEEGKYIVALEGRITIQRFNPRDEINKMWWKNYISHWMSIPELPKGV